ncbi:MAG: glycogen debranching enzyme, partial [Pirellulaceae bacterium]
ASILSRDRNGNLMPNPPLVEFIAEDPMLAETKIIAEAWDAAGAYQVGSFGDLRWPDTTRDKRWAEWNGRYRDDMRRFWRGDSGMLGAFATRLSGSADLYEHTGRQPYCSINFITSHDGFTLNDLVTYREKHNEANGEGNRDGDNNNNSDNYGVEGPTRRKDVESIRHRQVKNMIATLMLSHGVPMILMGDECRRTQRGNNNAYCQNNEISWFDWSLPDRHKDLIRFVHALAQFRRAQPTVRRKKFLTGRPPREGALPDVSWFNALGVAVDWHGEDLALIAILAPPDVEGSSDPDGQAVMLLVNATGRPREFVVPAIAKGVKWRLFVDTGAHAPKDAYPDLDGPLLPASHRVAVKHHSLLCFVADHQKPSRDNNNHHLSHDTSRDDNRR